jgi:hypothetical protein
LCQKQKLTEKTHPAQKVKLVEAFMLCTELQLGVLEDLIEDHLLTSALSGSSRIFQF